MELSFDKPQRQSAVGIVIMAAHTAFRILKSLFFVIILLVVKSPGVYVAYTFIGLSAIVVASLVYAYFSYLRFTFYLNEADKEFVVDKGIFNRDHLVIPLEKIQQVNITQDILQKIIGVYGLKIDTAGAKGEEVHIRAITEFAAIGLKKHLLVAKNETGAEQLTTEKETLTESKPLVEISNKTLLKVGLTSHYGQSLFLLLSFFYFVWYEGNHLAEAFKLDKNQLEATAMGFVGVLSVFILVAIFLLALLIINLVRTFYRYFELQVSVQNRNLLISSGFIAKKNTILNPNKVQIASYSQNYFQRKLDLVNLTIKQPHFGGAKRKGGLQGSVIHLPGCSPSEKDELMLLILSKLPQGGNTFLPNWRFVNLPNFFKIFLPALIFFFVAINNVEIKPYLNFVWIYLVIGLIMVYISYRNHKLMVSEDFIVKQKGIWDISQNILKPSNIQSITAFQYPWHKGIDVGHLNLHTAAGIIHFKYGNYTEIKLLVNYWLYLVEKSEENWG
ncbi:putative membrane protein [Pedobacter sp. UYP30]|uniref:PH domain-containing protein n=1 Tax=Pedobacter sp. UYP30 TaxID=1756400 RepID=UPI0033951AB5